MAIGSGAAVWIALQFAVELSIQSIGGPPAFSLDEWVGTIIGSFIMGWSAVRVASAVAPGHKAGVAFGSMVIPDHPRWRTMLIAMNSGEGWRTLANSMVVAGACRAYWVVNARTQ